MKKLFVALVASWLALNAGAPAYARQSSDCIGCAEGTSICIELLGHCWCLCLPDISFKKLFKMFSDAGLSLQEATAASNQVLTTMRTCRPGTTCKVTIDPPIIQDHLSYAGEREAHA